MKNIALVLLFLFSITTFSQDKKVYSSKSVDKVPTLITCKGNYFDAKECTSKSVQSHVYQKTNPNMIFKMKGKRKSEKVFIEYIVTEKGDVEKIKVKARKKKLKKKLFERMKNLPKFKPGSINNKPVSVKMELNLTISI